MAQTLPHRGHCSVLRKAGPWRAMQETKPRSPRGGSNASRRKHSMWLAGGQRSWTREARLAIGLRSRRTASPVSREEVRCSRLPGALCNSLHRFGFSRPARLLRAPIRHPSLHATIDSRDPERHRPTAQQACCGDPTGINFRTAGQVIDPRIAFQHSIPAGL